VVTLVVAHTDQVYNPIMTIVDVLVKDHYNITPKNIFLTKHIRCVPFLPWGITKTTFLNDYFINLVQNLLAVSLWIKRQLKPLNFETFVT